MLRNKCARIGTAIAVLCVMSLSIFMCSCGNSDSNGDSASNSKVEKTEGGAVIDADSKVSGEGIYINDKVLTIESDKGDKVSVGVKAGATDDGIYLNPVIISGAVNADYTYTGGFWIDLSRGEFLYSTDGYAPYNMEGYENFDNFIIMDHYYDTLTPATYVDDITYGVRWIDDYNVDEEPYAIITLRAVDVETSRYFGSYEIKIGQDDEGRYSIVDLASADVAKKGIISQEKRDELVDEAIAFLSDTLQIEADPFVAEYLGDWKDLSTYGAFVELCQGTYFPQFLDPESHTARMTDYICVSDNIFAVNLQVNYYGLVTIYFAPQEKLDEGYSEEIVDENLVIIGYDPFEYDSIDAVEMVTPSDFFDSDYYYSVY